MRARNWLEWAKSNATNILRLALVLLFLLLAVWAITLNRYGLVIANHDPWLWLTIALVSVGPELAGIVIGVVTIDYLNERRQDEQLKRQLILQLGSMHNDVTDTALRALKARGWLYDGSLSKAELWGTNLSGANLGRANLSGASFWKANLSGTLLERANLSRANLMQANLSRANLGRANLSGASFGEADLSGAHLWEVNLSGALLLDANLSGANLRRANLSGAILGRTNLSGAILMQANLSGAILGRPNLRGAIVGRPNLNGAIVGRANLSGANLGRANLSGAKHWTIEQLEQAKTLEGAIMPDEVQLGQEATKYKEHIEGPTFEEWKVQYLARQESGIVQNEVDSELDDTADEQTENDISESS